MNGFFEPENEVLKSRHKLPHWQQGQVWTFLTYRLADSLPATKLSKWRDERNRWLEHHPKPWDDATEESYHNRFSESVDEWLDQGHGSCLLEKPRHSETVAHAFLHFHEKRYQMMAFVIMPNHVHALFRLLPGHHLSEVVHSWKSFTALKINQRENRLGSLWQPDYWDRLIRNQRHFDWAIRYIQDNPREMPPGSFRLWIGASP